MIIVARLQLRFQQRVREIMESRGLSQSDLARAMGVHRVMVSKYLNGQRSPGLDVLENFALALGVEPSTLLVESEITENVGT